MELLLIKLIVSYFLQFSLLVLCDYKTPLRPLAQKDSRARNLKGPLFHIISTCLPKVRFDWPEPSTDIHRQQPGMEAYIHRYIGSGSNQERIHYNNEARIHHQHSSECSPTFYVDLKRERKREMNEWMGSIHVQTERHGGRVLWLKSTTSTNTVYRQGVREILFIASTEAVMSNGRSRWRNL